MNRDPFCESEWDDLCRRLERCLDRACELSPELSESFRSQAGEFVKQEPPADYPTLLGRVRGAAELAIAWRERQAGRETPPQRGRPPPQRRASRTGPADRG